MSIEDKIKRKIAEKLDVDIEDVVPEASFVNDLGAHSLAIVELMMSLEELLDIEIEDEEAETLTTVNAVLEFVKNKA